MEINLKQEPSDGSLSIKQEVKDILYEEDKNFVLCDDEDEMVLQPIETVFIKEEHFEMFESEDEQNSIDYCIQRDHKQGRHIGNPCIGCDICASTFLDDSNIDGGGYGSDDEVIFVSDTFKCELCNKMFEEKKQYLEHKLLHNNIQSCMCAICGKLFFFKLDLTLKVTGEELFCCDSCNKGNKVLSMTNTPSSTVAKKFIIMLTPVCDVPKKVVPKKVVPKSSVTTIMFSCNFCKMTFMKQDLLKQHIEIQHAKFNTCNICGKSCFPKVGSVLCDICNKKMLALKCDICFNSFPNENSLEQHKRIHLIENPFKGCKIDVCIAEGANIPSSIGQLSEGSSDGCVQVKYSFDCSLCNKKFSHGNDLFQHIHEHLI